MDPKSLFKYDHSMEMYNKLSAICPEEGAKVYWKWFLALSEIPRQSGHRDLPSEWLISIAKQSGLEYKVDKEKNICVYVPASKGYENKPSVCIQGHYDMVGTLAAGVEHNFQKDPIRTQLENGILSAIGTTLGADDGTGVACGLAYMELRDTFNHPAMEIMFTADEEIGCLGANGLQFGELITEKCKYLINVDSEIWGEVTISASGTCLRIAKVPVQFEKSKNGYSMIEIVLEKFIGGHSGIDILHQRPNAVKWIVDLIIHSKSLLRNNKHPYHIVHFDAGHAHNAIPSHAKVTIAVENEIVENVIEEIKRNHEALSILYKGSYEMDPEMKITSKPIESEIDVLTYTSTANIFQLLEKLPNGVLKFSFDVEGLVETSQSIGVGKLENDYFKIMMFARSSKDEDMWGLMQANIDMIKCHGGSIEQPAGDKLGWPADPTSHLLSVVKDSYRKLFNDEIKPVAIHAGLENSIIMEKYKQSNLQSISIGPTCIDVHTPKEYVIVETATKLYQLLIQVMESL